MLLSRDAIATAIEMCSAGDFYKPAHGHVFESIHSLYGQGEPADPVTVAEELRRAGLLEAVGGPPALVALQSNTPAIGNASRYARIVEEISFGWMSLTGILNTHFITATLIAHHGTGPQRERWLPPMATRAPYSD